MSYNWNNETLSFIDECVNEKHLRDSARKSFGGECIKPDAGLTWDKIFTADSGFNERIRKWAQEKRGRGIEL